MTAVLGLVLAVAFLFSMLGMGGGQIYTPVLYWLGLDLRTEAVPLALWLSFSTQSAAAISYWRHGLIEFHTGLPIIIGLVVFAPVGAILSHHTSEKLILFLFATMTVAALAQTAVGSRPRAESARSRRRSTFLALFGGATIGFLAGMVGRGGGSLVVPFLLLIGLDAKGAAATSAFAVCFSSLAGFAGHLGAAGPAVAPVWLAAFTLAAVVAALSGSRYMARRLERRTVKRVFTIVLAAIAAGVYWEVFVG